MKKIFFIFMVSVLLTTLVSCNDADFKSNNGSKKPQTDDQSIDPNSSEPKKEASAGGGDGTSTNVEIDTTVSCASKDVKDDTATFTFANTREIVAFVNSFCKSAVPTGWPNEGGMRNDDATKAALCKLKGYKTATSFTTFHWSSPYNNNVSWWDETTSSFFILYNATNHNNMVNSLTCTGKLYDSCVPAATGIDCTK